MLLLAPKDNLLKLRFNSVSSLLKFSDISTLKAFHDLANSPLSCPNLEADPISNLVLVLYLRPVIFQGKGVA